MSPQARDHVRKQQNVVQSPPQRTTHAFARALSLRTSDMSIPLLVGPYAEHDFSKIRIHSDESSVPSTIHNGLNSPDRPLDSAMRDFVEPRFGHDFSRVRVHTDAQAVKSARAVNALAYTVGEHIVFGAAQYQPETMPGKRLLLHELTHVVQQRGANRSGPLTIEPPGSSYEQEAKATSMRIRDHRNKPQLVGHVVMPTMQRDLDPNAPVSSSDNVTSIGSTSDRSATATSSATDVGTTVVGEADMAPSPQIGVPAVKEFPPMEDMAKNPGLKAERQQDWNAGLSDFKERGAWIMWATGSSRGPDGKMDYTRGAYKVNRWNPGDENDQGDDSALDFPPSVPANDSLFFCVGHYHQHPPLSPERSKHPENFPVGPSPKDTKIANNLGNPGIVWDFTDIKRTTETDYPYGPQRRAPL